MTSTELYTKGARVWIPHAEKVWQAATVVQSYDPSKKCLIVETASGSNNKTIPINAEHELPPLRNPDILIGENDLTSLSYLHEPAVLYNLEVRFCQQRSIYTYCGIVLVAINPYDELEIYDSDTIESYRGHAMGDLEPHIFAVAEEAYTRLEREQKNQSIIVSGESGAGKTVSAKYTMRYFATVGGSAATESQIEKKVLASSPIMEALGNAKTTRNDNSSRFGKFIELQFDKHFHISGASMRTYLLEKSRVVFQTDDERNYHIFYQLCAARDRLPHLKLDHQNKFHYLNQGDSPFVDGVDDLEAFDETQNAFRLLGFNEQQQDSLFRILAGILHLGNILFIDNEPCDISHGDKSFKLFCELMQIDEKSMRRCLCNRRIVSTRETIQKPMGAEEATAFRDALAKHIYAVLFQWVVQVINRTLELKKELRHKFIGVLDIYGFETFEINSFEQFCINYANEKLQQQFNMHVFKLEQEEYIREEIQWKMIEFYDNQPCIDLIESKLGVLDLLDEECRMPRGSDASWTEKLYSKCMKYSHFGKARFGNSAFVVNHFADRVQYESNGFLEKNRDNIMEEQVDVMRDSGLQLAQKLFSTDSTASSKLKVISASKSSAVSGRTTHKKSVGSQFRESLILLMGTLDATTPHYVRCIKPNDTKSSFEFNAKRAVQQLRACGVLETVRISAAGFPSRWTYVDFFYRYRVLCKSSDIQRTNMQATSRNIIIKTIESQDLYKFGKTKIFFRAGQVAYLEKLRAERLRKCCVIMQKTIRMFVCRKKYLRTHKAICNLQRYGRGFLARRHADQIRRHRASIIIQAHIRAWLIRIRFQRTKSCVTDLQKYARGYLARKRFQALKYNAKALIIQRHIRGLLARRRFHKMIRHIIVCQSAIRRFLARRKYKRLKAEARSIEHVKKLNKGLENKIISLQQRLDESNRIIIELKCYQIEVNDLRAKLVHLRALESELKNVKMLLDEKDKTINRLERVVCCERDDKIDLVNEQDKLRKEMAVQQGLWAQETAKLRKELDNINEIVKMNQVGAEQTLQVRLREEKMLLLNDEDCDRHAYQKLLQEYHVLETHCEDLERQQRITGKHRRYASDVSTATNSTDSSPVHNELAEDGGYGSVRSTSSKRETISNYEWSADGDQEQPNIDVGLVLKLQHKLAEVECENDRLQKRLIALEDSPRVQRAEAALRDSMKVSELETTNSKLKTSLMELQNSINEGKGREKLHEQLHESRVELDRRSDEIVQLKSVLANQAISMRSLVNSHAHRKGAYINEDGELALAYETQKTINKQLELELQDEKVKFQAHEREYKLEIQQLRANNEKMHEILVQGLSVKEQADALLQHEVCRLTAENLSLHEKNDELKQLRASLKKQLRRNAEKDASAQLAEKSNDDSQIEKQSGHISPVVRKKDAMYMGMFSYPNGEENNGMKILISDLKPRFAITLLPGLPAYIVFMMVRYTDHINDENKVKTLLLSFTNTVKKMVKKKKDNFEYTALWLVNTLRLLHNMKQYSGDRAFQQKNTTRQNEQCLRNFDLSEYRQVLSDIAVWIFQEIIRQFNEKVHPLIVPAVLEHEEIQGISSGFRSRASSTTPSGNIPIKPTTALLQELHSHYQILRVYGVDDEVVVQVFRQVFYFICASSLNNLLLRKELCHWSKGIQIRHNLSHLEMWIRDKETISEASTQAVLQPIIQAAHLLQARKSDEDVDSICDMCSSLRPAQICKILNLYTPVDEFEKRVSPTFIKKVLVKLKERPFIKEQQSLLMDVKLAFPVKFPFKPSDILLEEIEIPETLMLPMLQKI